MKAVIAGGTGLIGSALAKHLSEGGWDVVVLTRKIRDLPHGRAEFWDGESGGNWKFEIDGADVVINLCGFPIINRWSKDNLKKIESSRIGTTALIANAIENAEKPPKVWINASAVGYYGDTGSREVTEATRKGDGYLGDLCQRWEDSCLGSKTPDTRKVCLRLGVVLAKDSEYFKKTVMQTKAGLGSAIGTGEQYMSWIHIDDLVRMVDWCVVEQIQGSINAGSPKPVTNNEAMAMFRKVLGRPKVPNVPEFVIKMVSAVAGIEPSILLTSTRAYPEIAKSNGFQFKHNSFSDTVEAMLNDAPEHWSQA